MNYKLT